ncbi:DUF475 domain-containing protein [Chitinophaga sp.]|uniref:DUF475 domain-containing protein n=1 Tax=Chitinophaga sp. TaxID=1869181 RepID=UPI0031D2BBEB
MNISQDLSLLWNDIIAHPGTSIAVICNLIIIESLLSVDNAAVLATIVMDLPVHERGKALKFGIWGAYIFRGLAMIFAAVLVKIWWLKPLGGLYLLYLVYDWYRGSNEEEEAIDKSNNWLYKMTVGAMGNFWATVCIVEIMDMAFSIDNVFAAVAFSPNIILVCTGVFIGIFAMRFIAQWFVKLMEKYAFLETAAFIVIGILGLKLLLSLFEHFFPNHVFSQLLASHTADVTISVVTVLVFFVPVITSSLWNIPKKSIA